MVPNSLTSKPRDATSIGAQAQQLLELDNIAYTTLTRCEQPAQLLELDDILLNTLVRRPGPHPHRSDLLAGIGRSLVIRFTPTGQLQGLSDGFLLRLETLDRWRDSGECITSSKDRLPKLNDLPTHAPDTPRPASPHHNARGPEVGSSGIESSELPGSSQPNADESKSARGVSPTRTAEPAAVDPNATPHRDPLTPKRTDGMAIEAEEIKESQLGSHTTQPKEEDLREAPPGDRVALPETQSSQKANPLPSPTDEATEPHAPKVEAPLDSDLPAQQDDGITDVIEGPELDDPDWEDENADEAVAPSQGPHDAPSRGSAPQRAGLATSKPNLPQQNQFDNKTKLERWVSRMAKAAKAALKIGRKGFRVPAAQTTLAKKKEARCMQRQLMRYKRLVKRHGRQAEKGDT